MTRLSLVLLLLLAAPAALAAQQPAASAAPAAPAAPEGERTYQLSEVEVAPRPLNLGELQGALQRLYPRELRARRQNGWTQVRLRVEADGRVRYAQVSRSSHLEFDQPAVQAVRTLRFRPGRVDGQPVAVWVELPIEWAVRP